MDGSKFFITYNKTLTKRLIEDWQRLQSPALINQQELKNPKPHTSWDRKFLRADRGTDRGGTSGTFQPLHIETHTILRIWKLSHLLYGGTLIKDWEGVRHGNCFNLFVYGEDRGGRAHGTPFFFLSFFFIGNIWNAFITICSDRPKWFY